MKHTMVCIVVTLLLVACAHTDGRDRKKKHAARNKPATVQDTVINWRHIFSSGGMMPGIHPATDTSFISFRNGHFYTGQSVEHMHDEGAYHIVMRKTIYSATRLKQMLVVDAEGYSPVLYAWRNDTILLTDNHVEPFTNCYVRQR